ncbi:hypothetical protein BaRGS_00039703 [Batillaria attramentaria]|uniref:Uncharacterized protein n=1 Tax=Batillaria attramentaria TaxID=370345 RepID=A0ABD0J2Y0_9CAEN
MLWTPRPPVCVSCHKPSWRPAHAMKQVKTPVLTWLLLLSVLSICGQAVILRPNWFPYFSREGESSRPRPEMASGLCPNGTTQSQCVTDLARASGLFQKITRKSARLRLAELQQLSQKSQKPPKEPSQLHQESLAGTSVYLSRHPSYPKTHPEEPQVSSSNLNRHPSFPEESPTRTSRITHRNPSNKLPQLPQSSLRVPEE